MGFLRTCFRNVVDGPLGSFSAALRLTVIQGRVKTAGILDDLNGLFVGCLVISGFIDDRECDTPPFSVSFASGSFFF